MRTRNLGSCFAVLAAALCVSLSPAFSHAQEEAEPPLDSVPILEPAPELPPDPPAPALEPAPAAEPAPPAAPAPTLAPAPSSGAFPVPPTPKPAQAPAAPPRSRTVQREMPSVLPSTQQPTPAESHYERPLADAPAPQEPKKRREGDGLLGPIRLGVLVGGGLPNVLSLGAMLKITRFVGAGINVGFIPTIQISFYGDAKLSFQEYDAYGRIYPFGGAFFLGAGVGYASVRGSLTTTYDASAIVSGLGELTVPSEASVRTLVLTPQLGVLHIFGSGIALGADVGAQVPIAPSSVEFETQIPDTPGVPAALRQQLIDRYVTPNDKKVRDTLETIGRTVIPTMNVKVGFVF